MQKIAKKLAYDFTFELIQAKDYYDWMGNERFGIRYINTDGASVEGDIFSHIVSPDRYTPVGSVEFVSAYLRKFYPDSVEALKPLNVPEELFPYAGRTIVNVRDADDMNAFANDGLLYRKSSNTIKDPANGPFHPKHASECIGFQVSEPVDIQSEWRVFVFHDQVQHIANYSGDCLQFPDRFEINRMVETYEGHSPVAYTLDVGVGRCYGRLRASTFVIEVHRFFSCGLYGFGDHQRIPKMLSQTWYQMKSQSLKTRQCNKTGRIPLLGPIDKNTKQ